MDNGTIQKLGLAIGAILAIPLVLVVIFPLVVTFLGYLVAVPRAFLTEIIP